MARASERRSQVADEPLVVRVRREIGVPAAAMAALAETLFEESRRRGLDAFADSLERIRNASVNFDALLRDMLDGPGALEGEGSVAFRGRLRHDLGTPLNAVKGYGEIVVEDAAESGETALVADMGKLLAVADELLARIDEVGGAAPAQD
jgi:signal transduction histidine kinase